jgi:hypothetical protein
MNRKPLAIAGIAAVLAGGAWLTWNIRPTPAHADNRTPPRKSLEVTVYAQDFGMIREQRTMSLEFGANRLHVPDVSRLLDPQSVLLGWTGLNEGALPKLVAHTYDLGVANNDALLKRYLGQEVEVISYGENGRPAETMRGRLAMQEGNQVVLERDGKFYVQPPGTVVLPAAPDVVTIPQLSVQAESSLKQSADLDVAYLTRGLSWSADYVATLDSDADTLGLEGWATVTNQTGVDYPNAKVSLIAGTPNRAAVPAEARKMRLAQASAAPMYREELAKNDANSFGGGRARVVDDPQVAGEFYAYPVSSPTTIKQDQMNRVLMLSADKVNIKRDYSTRPPALSAWDYYGWGNPSKTQRGTVQAAFSFFNKDADGLGKPLPAGALRVYERDATGTLRYAGAAHVANTPKDDKINVTLSNAFDLTTEWKMVSSQKLDKKRVRKNAEIILHNEKKREATIRVVQTFYGGWKIQKSSHPYVKTDAQTVSWSVAVPAGGKTTLSVSTDFTY